MLRLSCFGTQLHECGATVSIRVVPRRIVPNDTKDGRMKPNTIRALLEAGQPTVGTHLFLTDPVVVETIGRTGAFDYVEILAQYAAFDLPRLEELCRAAELHALGTMIKLDWEGHRFYAQRSVASGFESVLFADSRSADDVRDCVRCLTPDTPEHGGLFGIGPRRHVLPAYFRTPDYLQVLTDTVVAIMVEKHAAVEALDEILAVEGVDMVQWGPGDYSLSIGRPGEQRSKAVRDVERRVFEACRDAGVPARAEIASVEDARYFMDLGVRHFCIGHDLHVLHDVLKDRGEELRSALAAGVS